MTPSLQDLTQRYEQQRAARDFLHCVTRTAGPIPPDNETARRYRAAVAAGDLSALRNSAAAFLAVVAAPSLLGQLLSRMRPVPMYAPILIPPADLVAHVTAEGAATPIDRLVVASADGVQPQVLRNIFPFFSDQLDSVDPAVQRAFEDTLRQLLREAWDNAFVDAVLAASTEVSGGVADLVRFVSAGNARAPVFLTSAAAAASLAELGPSATAAPADPQFGQVVMAGTGSIQGIPQYTTARVGDRLVLIDLQSVAVSDTGVEIERGSSPTLEMSDTPVMTSDGPVPGAMVSMYQTNSIALRAHRYLAWKFLTANCVGHIVVPGSGS